MSNEQTLSELKRNLWRYMATWRYAHHRSLSFAGRYQQKTQACTRALDVLPADLEDLVYCHDAAFQGSVEEVA